MKTANTIISKIIGDISLTDTSVPLTESKFKELFKAYPSFVDYFPIVDYLPESQTFLLDDGISQGVVYRAYPADTDGRADDKLIATLEKIDNAVRQLSKVDEFPYVCQIFQEDRRPQNIAEEIKNSIPEHIAKTKFTQVWLEEMREHFDMMCAPNGIYPDERVSSSGDDEKGWRAIDRLVHICIYRKAPQKVWDKRKRHTPAQQFNSAVKAFEFALNNAGIKLNRYDDNDLRNWLVPWLTPHIPGYDSPYEYLEANPLPKREENDMINWDLGEKIIHYPPVPISNREESDNGVIKLGDTYMRYVTLQGLDAPPDVGLMTQDSVMDNEVLACKFDQMPSETIFVWTIVPRNQEIVDRHIDNIHVIAAKSSSEYAEETEEQAKEAKRNRRQKAEIFQLQMGYFLRAKSLNELDDKRINAETVISTTPMRSIPPEYDLLADDAVIRNLPFVYEWEHDQKKALRSRMTYCAHIAATLPFFGRGLGGSLGYTMYRRDGQVFKLNPIKDKLRVAHKVLFGPSGSGKSATFVTQTAESMAIDRPRQIIIEKGRSFEMLMDYYEDNEIKVSRKQFTMKSAPSFPPYFETKKALMELRGELVASYDDDEDDERSYLGEMLSITQMMITAGKPEAERQFTQSKKSALQRALIEALHTAEKNGDPHARPVDVKNALLELTKVEEIEKIKLDLREMADALDLWITGTRGAFFNNHGQAFNDDDDVTHIDLGTLVANGNEDMLQVAILAIVYNISALGERHQSSGRYIEVLVDEGHYLARNPLAAQSFTTGVAVWRKLYTWLTIATQSFDDFKEDSKKILDQAEFWILLSMSASDAKKVSKFKELTSEQKTLIKQAKKLPGLYVEAVLLCESMAPALTRLVPPAQGLALGQTDGDEKKNRKALMQKNAITQNEAVSIIAEKIKQVRRDYAYG